MTQEEGGHLKVDSEHFKRIICITTLFLLD
jgi:hypothetical protein